MLQKIFTFPSQNKTTSNATFTLNVAMSEIPKYSIIKSVKFEFVGSVGFTFLWPSYKIQIVSKTDQVLYTSPEKEISRTGTNFSYPNLQTYFTADEGIQKINIIGSGTYRYWDIKNGKLTIDYEPPTWEIIIGTYQNGKVLEQPEIIQITPDTTIIKTLTAIPNEKYSFVKWTDSNGGIYTNPKLEIQINDQLITSNKTIITYTPFFERNNTIYVGTNLVRQIFIGTQPVKEIYVGTTRIYQNKGN